MSKFFSGDGKSKTKVDKSFSKSPLGGMDLGSNNFNVGEDLFESEPSVEFFEVEGNNFFSSNPIG